MSIEYIDKTHARLWVNSGSGKQRRRHSKRITYNGKKDAQRQLREFEEYIASNMPGHITVERIVNNYIDERELLGAKPTTIHGYKACQARIVSAFPGTLASELTLMDVQEFIAAQAKISAPKTVKNIVSLLNASYVQAMRKGAVKNNPCQLAILPKQKKPDIHILDKAEVADFLQDVEGVSSWLRLTCHLALFCGLRKSEILALTPGDVNVDQRTISVNKTRHRVNKADVIQGTKTKSSMRIVSFPLFMLDEIKQAMQHDYLICNEFDEPLNPNVVSKQFYYAVGSKYGISLHGLRHTHASILHDKGFSLAEVSAQLGHSSINTTLAIYTHIFDESRSVRVADVMEEMSPKSHQENKKPAVSNGSVAEDMGLEPL